MAKRSPHTNLPKVLGVEPMTKPNSVYMEAPHTVVITKRKYHQLPDWLLRHVYSDHYIGSGDSLKRGYVGVVILAKDELEAYTRFNRFWGALQALALAEEGNSPCE